MADGPRKNALIQEKIEELGARLDQRSRRGRVGKLRDFIEHYNRLDLNTLAASLTYYFIFAIVPFFLLLLGFVRWLGSDWISSASIHQISQLLPEPVLNFLRLILQDIRSGPGAAGASIGILALLWSASRGFIGLVAALDRIYGNPSNARRFFARQLLSILITVFVALSFVVVLFIMTFGGSILSTVEYHLKLRMGIAVWFDSMSFGLAFLYLVTLFSLLYHSLSKRRLRFRYALLCGTGVALSWLLLSFALSFYIRRTTRYSLLYGSVTGIIVLLLWLYLCTNLVLIGGLIHQRLRKRPPKTRKVGEAR